jgi:two-component system, OmpR family, sensor histidine kinase QseC
MKGPECPTNTSTGWGDRFFRLPGQADAGSGLGLSIARRVAALHGLVLDWHRTAGGFVARLTRAGLGAG